jgi:putative ABC transport system permease protein
MTVVGLVEDVKEDRINVRIDRPVWYVPFAQQTFAGPLPLPLNLVVRASGEPAEVAAAVREAVRAVDPHQPVANVMPVPEYLSDVLIVERFGAALMATLAVLGTALAAVGLYGVMAYSVSRRTGEIGLRMALGARPGHVLRLVLGQGGLLVLGGLLLGVVGAFGLTRLLASTLHEVSPSDPTTCAVVLLVLALVSLLACWLPARRATRLSPIVALRHE